MKHSLFKIILSLFTLVLSFPLSAQNLYPFEEEGKFGFKDETGKIIVQAKFENVRSFSEGMAGVKQNGKWGFIDMTGKFVIYSQFDFVCQFSEGLAGVKQNGKWGFIDKNGEVIITPQFEDIWSSKFTDGLAKVELNGSKFYIDKKGRRYLTREEGKTFLAHESQKHQGLHESLAQNSLPNGSTSQKQLNSVIQSKQVEQPKQKQRTQSSKSARTIDYADRMVDVDAGIPAGDGENYGTYAVVIGNEQYLDVAPVANAANDGRVMREYLVKTLGLPESNIIYFENASSAVMDRALSALEKKAKAAAGVGKKFNVIFYYSGHGVPAENTQEAYLLPVDVSPSNLNKYGLPLSDVYRRLGALNAQCVTVFLDACFSGAGRDNRMLAEVKGVQLEPKKSTPTGNMVVLSACSGRETANIFKEGKHGLFTYWLLRKLKETKGDVTLGELQEHLQKYVDYTATNRLNLESGQKPTVQASPTLGTDWRTIRLR